jgi:hypothetical protein
VCLLCVCALVSGAYCFVNMMNTGDFSGICSVSRAATVLWRRIEVKKRERLAIQRRICKVIDEQKQIFSNGTRYYDLENKFVSLLDREDQLVADISTLVREVVRLKAGAEELQALGKKLRDRGRDL